MADRYDDARMDHLALCLGVGDLIALGDVMHAPGLWPLSMT
jgi:hypothetical protein